MIRTLLFMIIASSATVSAAAGSLAGAFAVNPDRPGQYGFTFNRDSPRQAERLALRNCGDGCEIVKVFVGGCGAYAIDTAQDNIVLGFGAAPRRSQAKAVALKNCQALGGSACADGNSGCNGRRPGRSK